MPLPDLPAPRVEGSIRELGTLESFFIFNKAGRFASGFGGAAKALPGALANAATELGYTGADAVGYAVGKVHEWAGDPSYKVSLQSKIGKSIEEDGLGLTAAKGFFGGVDALVGQPLRTIVNGKPEQMGEVAFGFVAGGATGKLLKAGTAVAGDVAAGGGRWLGEAVSDRIEAILGRQGFAPTIVGRDARFWVSDAATSSGDAAAISGHLTRVGRAPDRITINSFEEYKTISGGRLKSNTVYEYNGAEFETDGLGRSISTRGTINTSNPGQRLPVVDKAIGNHVDALSTDVGFHRGADSLGFPGGNLNVNPGNGFPIPANFPGVPNLNGGAYKQLENTLRKLDNGGNKVYANFEAIFNDGNLTRRPDAFQVTYSVNGGMPRVRLFLNQPGG